MQEYQKLHINKEKQTIKSPLSWSSFSIVNDQANVHNVFISYCESFFERARLVIQ